MIVGLADAEISKLERQGRLIRCVAVVCRVCGFRQHAHSDSYLPAHERCPRGCVLPIKEGQCRLCGDPRCPGHAVCMTHIGRNYHRFVTGLYSTHIADTHWHAADRTGPVSQYAVI